MIVFYFYTLTPDLTVKSRSIYFLQHSLYARFLVECIARNKKIKQDSRRAIVLNVQRLALNILLCWDAGIYACCYMNKHTAIHTVKHMTV